MTTSGASGLKEEQIREINSLLDGDSLSIESIDLLQQVSSSSDPVECDRVLDEVNDKLIEFSLKFASNTELNLNAKSLTRLSPSLIAFLQRNKDSLIHIDLSNNALNSLSTIFTLALPHLQTLALANNSFSTLEIEQIMTSFPHAKVITKVEPEVILPLPRKAMPQTPQFAKMQTESAEIRKAKIDESKEAPKKGFFNKLFKK